MKRIKIHFLLVAGGLLVAIALIAFIINSQASSATGPVPVSKCVQTVAHATPTIQQKQNAPICSNPGTPRNVDNQPVQVHP
jgi:hypothetical protein